VKIIRKYGTYPIKKGFPCRKSIENMGHHLYIEVDMRKSGENMGNHLYIEIYIGKSGENMGNHNQKDAMIREIWQNPSIWR